MAGMPGLYKRSTADGYGFEDFWTSQHIDYFTSEFHWGFSSAHSAYLDGALSLGLIGMGLHTLVLVLGTFRAIRLYKFTHSLEFLFAASLFALYLLVGVVESVLVVTASPVSFYFGLALCLVCTTPYDRHCSHHYEHGMYCPETAMTVRPIVTA